MPVTKEFLEQRAYGLRAQQQQRRINKIQTRRQAMAHSFDQVEQAVSKPDHFGETTEKVRDK